MMPSRGRKFITEFLLPSLNEKRFGCRLMWLDIEKKVFQVQWNHKSASDWTTNDAVVFAAWDKRKGNYKPDDKEYYSKSKQRFRAALYKFIKLKHITELFSQDKYTKIYCFGDGQNISGTFVTAAKSEKENEGNVNTSLKVKQNPEDVVLNWDSTWNANQFTDPQGNSLVIYYHEMNKESFIEEEQVVIDYAGELIPDLLHSENPENYMQSLNPFSGFKKSFSARETSNVMKENDLKLLNFIPKTNICKKDNFLKKVTIENENFHDNIGTIMDTSIQMEWSNHEFDETDGLIDLPLAKYIHY